MPEIRSARPYTAAHVLLCREGKYLFVRRVHTGWMDGYYGLPSGKVEPGEGFLRAAVREAREEVGVNIAADDLSHAVTMWRKGDEPGAEWCSVTFATKTWQGEPYNAEPDVHDDVQWFSPGELPDKVIPSVRRMIESFEAGITYSEPDQNIAK